MGLGSTRGRFRIGPGSIRDRSRVDSNSIQGRFKVDASMRVFVSVVVLISCIFWLLHCFNFKDRYVRDVASRPGGAEGRSLGGVNGAQNLEGQGVHLAPTQSKKEVFKR